MACPNCGHVENLWGTGFFKEVARERQQEFDQTVDDRLSSYAPDPSPEAIAKRTRDAAFRAADAALSKAQRDANFDNKEAKANAEAAYYAELRRIREAKP
jgi:hypothetical protein